MKKFLFSVFIFTSIALFVYLGLWQVDRMRWKDSLIEQVNLYKDADYEEFKFSEYNLENDLFKKVKLYGSFMHEDEILLHAKYRNAAREKEDIGFHVITPFVTTDGVIVFVNRGWVPEKYRTINDRTESRVRNNIQVPVEGIIRKSTGKAPWFMPQNTPEEDVWFWADIPVIIKRLAETTDLNNMKPVYIQQTNLTTYNNFPYPEPVNSEIKFYNQHFTYVVTWFSLAFITLIMWYIWLRRNDAKKSESKP